MSHSVKGQANQSENNENNAFALLRPDLQRALAEKGYTSPTPIQAQAIPHILKGHDLIGCAQTGTGKTAAFTLPILQYLDEHKKPIVPGKPRILILAPTRELAAQIGDSVVRYGRHMRVAQTVIFGGVGQQPQVSAIRRGIQILIATPGRLLDLMEQGYVRLEQVEVFVLDEADRMLDMGFIHDIKKVIAKLPAKRQTLFFSATMEPAVMTLARSLVHEPVDVAIEPEKPAVDRIVQKVYFVDKPQKDMLLISLLKDSDLDRVILFTRTKRDADKVAKKLTVAGIRSAAIHGNKSQGARTEALAYFKSGKVRVLVATDIAARGLDVRDVSHVINYHLPNEPETYVHRIGRTARAGADGDAISFCSADERGYLRSIERLIRKPVPFDPQAPFHSEIACRATGPSTGARGFGARRNSGRPSGGFPKKSRAPISNDYSRDRWSKKPASRSFGNSQSSGYSRQRNEGFSKRGRG